MGVKSLASLTYSSGMATASQDAENYSSQESIQVA